jgi:hypothetical protein
MTRDPEKLCRNSEAELSHDTKGIDVESIQEAIEQSCEDLINPDWVHEAGRDMAAFELEIARLCFASCSELDLRDSIFIHQAPERFARICQLFRDQFKFYAEKAAIREAQRISEDAPY